MTLTVTASWLLLAGVFLAWLLVAWVIGLVIGRVCAMSDEPAFPARDSRRW